MVCIHAFQDIPRHGLHVFTNVAELCTKWPPSILWTRAKGTLMELNGLIPVDPNQHQNLLQKFSGLGRNFFYLNSIQTKNCMWLNAIPFLSSNLYQLRWTEQHGTCPTKLNEILHTMSLLYQEPLYWIIHLFYVLRWVTTFSPAARDNNALFSKSEGNSCKGKGTAQFRSSVY